MPISEYIIKQKCEGRALLKRLLAIVGYIALAALLLLIIALLSPPLFYLPFFLIAAALVATVIFVTWKFLSVEYEIIIGNGEMCASVIYGRSITRRLLSIGIHDITEIGAYDDEAYVRLCSLSLQKNVICISSLSAPEIFYAIYDDGRDRCVLYFETDERGLSILKRDNPSAFKVKRK